MKKGAKKEPSGEWGVRGSFLRVFFAMANLTGLYKLSISLDFACISEKIRWQHQKEFNFVHKILSHQRSRRWFEDPGKNNQIIRREPQRQIQDLAACSAQTLFFIKKTDGDIKNNQLCA